MLFTPFKADLTFNGGNGKAINQMAKKEKQQEPTGSRSRPLFKLEPDFETTGFKSDCDTTASGESEPLTYEGAATLERIVDPADPLGKPTRPGKAAKRKLVDMTLKEIMAANAERDRTGGYNPLGYKYDKHGNPI